MSLKVLFVGSLAKGETSMERMLVMKELGHDVVGLDSIPYRSFINRICLKLCSQIDWVPDLIGLNRRIKRKISSQSFDVIWVEKGILLTSRTLKWIKRVQPLCKIVHLNPDDPFGQFRRGWRAFLSAVPFYDVHFVPRALNIPEYKASGAARVVEYDRSFSARVHRPVFLSDEEKARFSVPVGFIGSYAPAREHAIAGLISKGVDVAVYGGGWKRGSKWPIIRSHYRGGPYLYDDYTKVINGMGIALHFLRRENRDEQDSRSFEIPACGTLMIAERSAKHEQFFDENREAVFFDDGDELLRKVRYYLSRPAEAELIAAAGRKRCLFSGYDHNSRLKSLLETALK